MHGIPPFVYCPHTCAHDESYLIANSRRHVQDMTMRGCPILTYLNKTSLKNHRMMVKGHPNCNVLCPGHDHVHKTAGAVCDHANCQGLGPKAVQIPYTMVPHEEWVTWGQRLWVELEDEAESKFPPYYKAMAAHSQPPPPPPPPGTNIWLTQPPLLPPTAGPSHLPLSSEPTCIYTSVAVGSTPTPDPSQLPSSALSFSGPPSTLLRRPNRKFQGIIVQEMSRDHETDEYADHWDWGCFDIPGDIVNPFLEAMPNNMFKDNDRQVPGNWYYAREFMSLGIEMFRMGWDVRFLRWADFRDSLCSQNGEIWDLLKGVDVIVGGADLSGDYMGASACYEFTSDSLQEYINGASALATSTIIWPDPLDLIVAGQKIHWTKRFADINEKSCLMAPMMHVLKAADDLPKHSSLAVIKRGYSERSRHVYFNKSQNGLPLRSVINQAMEETQENWKGFPRGFVPKWFVQPLLKTMIELGEAKLFFVDLEYLYGVVTAPVGGKLNVTRYCGSIPLSNLLIGTHQVPEISRKALYINPYEKEAPRQLRKVGQVQLEAYAKAMLLKLIELEEGSRGRLNGGPCRSGLRYMARMDVGIVCNASTGELSYWLNDIERGHCTGMFSKIDWDGFMEWAPTMIWMWENTISK